MSSGERDPKTGRFPKGNGAGKGQWGGPAKGMGAERLMPKGDDYSDTIRALSRDPKHAEAKVAMRELVWQTWVSVAQGGDTDASRVAAATQMAKRVGMPEEPVETRVTGAEGGPVFIVTGVPRADAG